MVVGVCALQPYRAITRRPHSTGMNLLMIKSLIHPSHRGVVILSHCDNHLVGVTRARFTAVVRDGRRQEMHLNIWVRLLLRRSADRDEFRNSQKH